MCYPSVREHADMTETPLWSMIISGIWIPMMNPTHFTILHDRLNHKLHIPSLCLAIIYLSGIRSSVSLYLVRSHYRQALFTHFTIWHPSWPSHMLASFVDVISSSGPRGITPSLGWTNPTLDPYASTTTFGIPESLLYDHPVTVWRLMSSKHPSSIGD